MNLQAVTVDSHMRYDLGGLSSSDAWSFSMIKLSCFVPILFLPYANKSYKVNLIKGNDEVFQSCNFVLTFSTNYIIAHFDGKPGLVCDNKSSTK